MSLCSSSARTFYALGDIHFQVTLNSIHDEESQTIHCQSEAEMKRIQQPPSPMGFGEPSEPTESAEEELSGE